jgi:hypothetical protein
MDRDMQQPTEHERKVAREEARKGGGVQDEPGIEDRPSEGGAEDTSDYETEIEAERHGTDAEEIEREESERKPISTGRWPTEPTR